MILYIHQINKQIDSRKTERETIKMTETMVNGMKFRVWSDTTKRATFAESEDGRVEKIHDCGYITVDLTIRKAIAMVYGLPTFRKNAVKTASAVEETPVTESKEQEAEATECTEVEIEEYDEDDETPVNKRQYDVYYTDGQNETNTTLDAETAEEALKEEQIEIDSWNEEEGYEKYRITKVRYAI